jgi:DNA (cytosine-5)-methyltransferase 1
MDPVKGGRPDIYQANDQTLEKEISKSLAKLRRDAPTVASIIRPLGKAGTVINPHTCTAKISFAKSPILRKSPYAGMLFNGAGRPLRSNGYATTLPASMGGNKTPIIDEAEIFEGEESFIEAYHASLIAGTKPREGNAPKRLRRLTIRECMAIQTFPAEYRFAGRKSAIYRQIGNAVPCDLTEAVASAFRYVLELHEAAAVRRDVA